MAENDADIVAGIKRAMTEGKVSIRTLAARTGIPYRSLQNYLSGTTRLPASAYVEVCKALGIDNQYVLQGNFQLPHMELWDALWDVFGDALVSLKQAPNTSGFETMELHNQKQAAASNFAAKISEAYNQVRLERLRNRAEQAPPTLNELRTMRARPLGITDDSSEGPQ